ncbi:helix-turn-helix domain-containing protein [Lactobacillus sp. PV034]|uniref:helix-turn-helix domain-containing protein n=1 Tax=Lactobacillus sp. PV034 TaxID=2594495 RepID=UPI00223FF1EF|nr:helix-turn-helix transcriptional regulator [Lactobacillus sp. PV034]
MKIGVRLKNIRKFLGLTQLQFSAGVVTESFYSRVENGRSNISMSKLIELLNYHHVSLYDFFEPAFKGNIEQQAVLAFLDRDVKRLEHYQPINDKQETAIQLMLNILWGGKSGF